MKMQNVAIILKPEWNQLFPNVVINLIKWLIRKKVKVQILLSEKEAFKTVFPDHAIHLKYIDAKDLKQQDLIISLGGDGTIIGLSRLLKSKVPIFGVNWGRLGFITEFSAESMYEHLSDALAGNVDYNKVPLSKVTVERAKKNIFQEHFLNDVVLSKSNISRLFAISIECNKEIMQRISGDGLIISTPIGSTAYSLAAGGPIVHPLVKSFILSPICPHSLLHRPIVVPSDFELGIRLEEKDRHITLTVDGQVIFEIDHHCFVKVSIDPKQGVVFVKNPDRTYFRTMREKFFPK
jgi:NAD+ kinase